MKISARRRKGRQTRRGGRNWKTRPTPTSCVSGAATTWFRRLAVTGHFRAACRSIFGTDTPRDQCFRISWRMLSLFFVGIISSVWAMTKVVCIDRPLLFGRVKASFFLTIYLYCFQCGDGQARRQTAFSWHRWSTKVLRKQLVRSERKQPVQATGRGCCALHVSHEALAVGG